MKKLLLLLLSLSPIVAQSTFIPYNRDYYHLIDRFQIKYSFAENILPTTFKPLRRSDLSDFLLSIQDKYDSFSTEDQFSFEFLMNDNWEWTNSPYNENAKNWWNLAYERKSDFYVYQSEDFIIRVNPMFYFTRGKDEDEPQTLYTNTRGIEVQGMIDDKIGFYSMLTTTQSRFPRYVHDFIRTNQSFPNEGYWKDGEGGTMAWDFFHARGYITFDLSKSIDVQVGHDKKFIGQGLRSMVLSDFSSPFLFGQINTKLGKVRYTNLFGQLTENIIFAGVNPGDGDYPKKYLIMHRLSINLLPHLELGVFETIMSGNANINYFNSLIFYRALEQQEGSPDNTLVGLDFNYVYKNSIQLYGQFVLDEFVIDVLRSGNGDWRNKYGVQLGAKYLDALNLSNLDLQIEYNIARPYFYAYEDPALSFTNYRNPLAHPMGANFREIFFSARYQPSPKVSLNAKVIRTLTGEDSNGQNFGGELLKTTNSRIDNFGNSIGQGLNTKITYIETVYTYSILSNLFADFSLARRRYDQKNNSNPLSSSLIGTLSLRWNLPQRVITNSKTNISNLPPLRA